MSFYTDWFIADEAEAESLAVSESPFDHWPSLSLQGIGELDLMALWAILQHKAIDQADPVSIKLLFQGSDQGPFVVRIAPEFIDRLTEIPSDQDAVAWSKTEGLVDVALTDVFQIVAQLSAFAKQSRLEGKPVLGLFTL